MYGVEHKFLAILFSGLVLFLAMGIKRVAGTYLIPCGIFALSWFAFTILPLVILFEVPINSLAIFYIFVSTLMFCLSALPFNWRLALKKNNTKSLELAKFDSNFLKVSLYISAAGSIILSLLTMVLNGFSINQVIFDLILTSGQYAATRGTEGVEYGIVGVLSLMFTYLCPVIGGLRMFAPRKKWFFLLSMAPSMFTMVVQSSKLVFLISLFFYLSSAIVAKIYACQFNLPKLSGLPKFIISAAIVAPLILISFISRIGEFDPNNFGNVIEPLAFAINSYTLGQLYAFSDFFSYTIGDASNSPFKDDYYSLGAYTFASIFDMLGVGKDFPPGMYDESGSYLEIFQTNIFTFFRGLIYDFGILGSLLFMFVFGLICHFVAYKVFIRNNAWFSVAILIALLVFIFMGYLFSVFVARYMFLNIIVVGILLNINTLQSQGARFNVNYPNPERSSKAVKN